MKFLIIDDDPVDAKGTGRALKNAFRDLSIDYCDGGDRAQFADRQFEGYDCILLDYAFPHAWGPDFLKIMRAQSEELPPVVMISGTVAEPIVLQSMREGAEDYIHKDELSAALIRRVVLGAIERSRLKAKLREQERQMAFMAMHDGLTGLANRSLFQSSLSRAIEASKRGRGPFALLMIDLDQFKAINDTHGHQAGDAVLQATASRLQDEVRGADQTFRLGGDEFAALLDTQVSAEGVRALAERLTLALAEPVAYGDLSLPVGASIGTALWPDDADDSEALIAVADARMYEMKRVRRGEIGKASD